MNLCTVPYADEKLKIQIHYLFQKYLFLCSMWVSMIDTTRQSRIVKGQKFLVHQTCPQVKESRQEVVGVVGFHSLGHGSQNACHIRVGYSKEEGYVVGS